MACTWTSASASVSVASSRVQVLPVPPQQQPRSPATAADPDPHPAADPADSRTSWTRYPGHVILDTYHTDEWVTAELVVLGDSLITHIVNGEPVLSYARPVIGGGVVNDFDTAAKPDGTALTGGYIALQSESHPVQFRRVLLRQLTGG